MVTKKQLKKEIDDLKKQIEQLNKAKEVSEFLRDNPKGAELSIQGLPFMVESETGWTFAGTVYLTFVYNNSLKTVDVACVTHLKKYVVVQETERRYTVRIDREWKEEGEIKSESVYYRVNKETGNCEDTKDDKELWSEAEQNVRRNKEACD